MLRRIWINKDSLQHIVARSLLGYHSSLSGCFFSPAPKREKERGGRERARERSRSCSARRINNKVESELLQILFRVPEADDAAADVCLKKKKKRKVGFSTCYLIPFIQVRLHLQKQHQPCRFNSCNSVLEEGWWCWWWGGGFKRELAAVGFRVRIRLWPCVSTLLRHEDGGMVGRGGLYTREGNNFWPRI